MRTIKTIISIAIFIPSILFAQGIKNNGARIVVKENVEVVISGETGNYSNQHNGTTDGELYLDGTLTVRGSFFNNSNGDVFVGTDTIGLVITEDGTRAVHELGGTGTTKFENLYCPASNTVKIPENTEVRVKYNFTLDGTLDVYGDLYIEAIFINNGTITGNGTVHYESTEPQIVAPGTYPNLVLDNPGGLVLEGEVFVEDELVLSLGALIIGENNLILGPNAVIVETKAPGTWVDATSTGYVIKMYDQLGTFEFPVGNFGTNPVYSPVTVNLKQATFSDGQISVRLKPEAHPDNNTGPDFPNYLNRYWEVEASGLSNVLYDISFWYDESDVTGNEDSIDGGKYKSDEVTHWLHYNRVDTDDHHFEATDLNTFSVFSGVQGFRAPTLAISSPANHTKVYEYELNLEGTASDKDGDLEEIRVKLNDGIWQTATGTGSWTKTLTLVPGINTIQAKAKDDQDFESGISSIEVLLSVQEINIPQGWSYISSFLDPVDPDVVNMMSDLVGANSLVILSGVNGIYAPPPFSINTLHTWEVNLGYKVKMAMADQLVVRGDALDENTVNFGSGLHLIPVLTNETTPLSQLFDSPSTDILYMLDIYNNFVYWPNGQIYTLTELAPGKGYLVNLVNPVTLSYPELSGFSFDGIYPQPPAPGPWACTRNSNFHLISLSAKAVKDLPNADYIGAFDSQGNCVGYAALEKTGENILLTVYGDEPITAENDGLMEGELLRFRSFSLGDNAEKELTATFNPTFPNADGLFYINGLSGISGFKESSTGLGENNLAASVEIYPNPAKEVVTLTLTGFQTLSGLEKGLTATLLTAEGKLVKTFSITSPTTQLDVSDLQTGIYLMKIASENQIVIKRLVIQ